MYAISKVSKRTSSGTSGFVSTLIMEQRAVQNWSEVVFNQELFNCGLKAKEREMSTPRRHSSHGMAHFAFLITIPCHRLVVVITVMCGLSWPDSVHKSTTFKLVCSELDDKPLQIRCVGGAVSDLTDWSHGTGDSGWRSMMSPMSP